MLAKCKECNEDFKWDSKIIIVNDEPYCDDCVKLYPTGYVAFIGDDWIGETENDDGQDACELFDYLLDED